MIPEESEVKLSCGKRAKRPIFVKKSTLFEQKVDLKSKPLDFRDLGIFAER